MSFKFGLPNALLLTSVIILIAYFSYCPKTALGGQGITYPRKCGWYTCKIVNDAPYVDCYDYGSTWDQDGNNELDVDCVAYGDGPIKACKITGDENDICQTKNVLHVCDGTYEDDTHVIRNCTRRFGGC